MQPQKKDDKKVFQGRGKTIATISGNMALRGGAGRSNTQVVNPPRQKPAQQQ